MSGRAGQSWHEVLSALTCAVLCALLIAFPQANAQGAKTTDLLAFIRHLEAGGASYNAFERRISVPPPKRLTTMSISEVLAWQKRVRAAGDPSTAAGGYQIIWPTLDRLVKNGTVSKTAIFNADTQDHLARALISECGSGTRRRRFANCLAGIWAALPRVSGTHRGRSAHHGIAGNRAHTTPKTVLALLAGKAVPIGRSSLADNQGDGAPVGAALSFSTIAKPPPHQNGGQGTPSRARIAEAMRKARKDGTLTPSVRIWKVDPYAQE